MKRGEIFSGRKVTKKKKPVAAARRRPTDREIKHLLRDIKKSIQRTIMNQAELSAAVRELNTGIKDVQKGVDKVSGEVDVSIQKIKDLEASIGGDASAEVIQDLAEAKASLDTLKASITAVDDKIPDPVPL